MSTPFDFNTYRNASTISLEGKTYLAACYFAGTEAQIREVGRIAFSTGCAIWHATWIVTGKKHPCQCADCVRARKPLQGCGR